MKEANKEMEVTSDKDNWEKIKKQNLDDWRYLRSNGRKTECYLI